MIYFDLDNTLIDYNSSERKAIEFIFKEKYGLVLNNNQTDYWVRFLESILIIIYQNR